MVAETVKEAGCLTYASSRDINDPDLIRTAERWKTPASPSSRAAAQVLARAWLRKAWLSHGVDGAEAGAWR
jgi:quinol monooxygenase YgiN